jgi:DNA-binding CsgD family transcriptional regulator
LVLSQRTESALAACLDAVVAPTRWPGALQSLAESFGAASCTFCSHDLQELSSLVMPVSSAHVDFANLWMQNQAHAPDPHFFMCPNHDLSRFSTVLEDDITTADMRRRIPYYQETARIGDRDWWAATCFRADDQLWCLPLYRRLSDGPFQRTDASQLAAVAPYLSRIISLAKKFAAFRTSSELATLERIGCAALVIDVTGCVTDANSQAVSLLAEDLAIVRRRLTARDAESNRKLKEIIASALATRPAEPVPQQSVAVPRDGLPWLLVEAMPVTRLGSNVFETGRIILLLTDLTSPARPDGEQLRATFGLTPAETRLAVNLASGHGLDAAAEILGISRATASSQIKAIFAKTGTGRQAELVGLMAKMRPRTRH